MSHHTDRPTWNDNGNLEIELTEAQRHALDDDRTRQLTEAFRTALVAIADMRTGRVPADAERALWAADRAGRWMEALRAELLVSGLVSHGRAGIAMNVSRSTAQDRRRAADAEGITGYRSRIADRTHRDDPTEYYRPRLAASAPTQTVTIGGGVSLASPGSVTMSTLDGRRSFTTDAYSITLDGQRVDLADGESWTVGRWHLLGTPTGIHGTEQ